MGLHQVTKEYNPIPPKRTDQRENQTPKDWHLRIVVSFLHTFSGSLSDYLDLIYPGHYLTLTLSFRSGVKKKDDFMPRETMFLANYEQLGNKGS